MRVLVPQTQEPFQGKQVRKTILRKFRDELLPFPAFQLAIFQLQQTTDFLASVCPTRFAHRGMLRVFPQHTAIIASRGKVPFKYFSASSPARNFL